MDCGRLNPAKITPKHKKTSHKVTGLMALHPNFDTIAVRVHFGAAGCIRVQFVLVLYKILKIKCSFWGICQLRRSVVSRLSRRTAFHISAD